jgi:hypothetical protein
MRHIVAGLAVTLASALGIAACSSPVTAIESDRMLSRLSAEERRQYCEDEAQYLRARVPAGDLKKISCASAAAVIVRTAEKGRARVACRQVYQACLSSPLPEPQRSCETFSANAASCAATVGEATRCAEERADALEKLASDADDTCDGAGQGTVIDRGQGNRSDRGQATDRGQVVDTKTEACNRVELLCPSVFGAPSSSSSGTGKIGAGQR